MNSLVSQDWLQKNLSDVVVVDATYYLSTMGKNAEEDFVKAHIPGAQRWNIDVIADTTSTLKHMMPEPHVVAEAAGSCGIGRDTRVVVYDQLGMFSAARVWLTLKTIGHPQIALLDGGLPAWQGDTVAGDADDVETVVYEPFDSNVLTVDRHTVSNALNANDTIILDARSAGRFQGIDPEPVAGLRGGHMPGALNVPYTLLLDSEGLFKQEGALRDIFIQAGLSGEECVITSCGSGVTACILTFALHLIGVNSKVYDGSWSEWGQEELGLPVVV